MIVNRIRWFEVNINDIDYYIKLLNTKTPKQPFILPKPKPEENNK